MAEKSITLQIQPRGRPIRKLPREITVPADATSADIYTKLASASNFSIHRLRITKGSDGTHVPNSGSTALASTGLRDRSTIAVKDLGPQVSWTTVFVIEYAGPILFHLAVYFARPYIYRNPNGADTPFPPPQSVQTLALWLICLHFAKRELETLFVHRFSLATMPVFNIFKNSAHYWVLSGLNIALWIYAPAPDSNTAMLRPDSPVVRAGLVLYVIGELGNFYSHLVLANLRPKGTTTRAIPRGFAFDWVTCPNYMFEMIAWTGISLVTWSFSTVLFSLVSGGQMVSWAWKKEKRYRKEFGDKYKKKRYAMIPGLI